MFHKCRIKIFIAFFIIFSFIALTACNSTPSTEKESVPNGEIERALTPEQFEEKISEEGVVVIDLRREEEIAVLGFYKDSLHIPYELLKKDPDAALELLPEDKDATLLIYCKVGGRARNSIDIFVEDFGYKNAYYLAGPIYFDEDGNISGY